MCVFDKIALGRCQRRGVYLYFSVHYLRCQGIGRTQARQIALINDTTAVRSRALAKLDDVVCKPYHLTAMLHNENIVVLVTQIKQELSDTLRIGRVQARSRLIKDIGDVGKTAPQIPYHFDTL